MFKRLEDRLRMAFNTVEFREEDYMKIGEQVADPKTANDGRIEARQVLRKLELAEPRLDALTEVHRDLIDSIFQQHFGMTTNVALCLGNLKEAKYASAFSNYRFDVCKAMSAAIMKLGEKELKSVSEEVRNAMEMAAPKARLLLDPQFGRPSQDYSVFPFMSRSCYLAFQRMLSNIPGSLTEVSFVSCRVLFAALTRSFDRSLLGGRHSYGWLTYSLGSGSLGPPPRI